MDSSSSQNFNRYTGNSTTGLKIIHEDATLLVVDKPAGMPMEEIAGLPAHRLDKDTSGVLLIAKDKQTLEFLHEQFKERKVEKRYICLVEGNMKESSGVLHTLLARSPADRRKQRTYPLAEPKAGRREAITEWKVLQRFPAYAEASTGKEGYTLLEVAPKTGRKHQVRAHMASVGHPIAGDKLYGFKTQRIPKGLARQFLHASYLKVGDYEFSSKLPKDLQTVLEGLNQKSNLKM